MSVDFDALAARLGEARLVGGLPVNPATGRSHGVYRHDPSTMRLSMAAPNLTNIPRGSSPLGAKVRDFFIAPPGKVFVARDFSGVEAIKVGYFANAPRIMRIFQLDGHSFFTAHALYELDKSIPYADLPQESWSDTDLRDYLARFKKAHKATRDHNKQITHGANYMETASMAQVLMLNNLGVLYPLRTISRVMEFYHALFPEIRRWHLTLASEVGGAPPKGPLQRWGYEARNTWVRTPFNVTHRYYDVVKWEKTPKGWDWTFGEDAKRLAALLPQSTARFCLTRAAQRIWDDPERQDVARCFRLFIHDELLMECAEGAEADRCEAELAKEMERPIPELVLPDGTLLALGTEGKRGRSWGSMK